MRLVSLFMAVCAAGGFLQTVRGEAASLVVRADLDCRWSVDGKPEPVLKSGEQAQVNLPPGEHHVEAVPLTGGPQWETTVTLRSPDPQQLTIPLRAAVARAEASRLGYWIDPATHLMWAAVDNGFGVSWTRAAYYCESLTLAGHKDWKLPSIDDLQHIFGGPSDDNGHRTLSPIKVTGWEWSSSPGQEPGEQWALDFGDGGRASVVTGDSGLNRALCVRH